MPYYPPSSGGSGAVSSVNGQVGDVVLTTTEVAEGTNLYYTTGRFDTRFAAKSTTDLAEGTNLYWTNARFDTRLGTKTTTDLAEGANLYFTDARARTAAVSDTAYNATTWDTVVDVAPSKNAVRDQVETMLTSIAGKEPTIVAGTTAQYWRGDKSWQTLNTTAVAEGTNLYYTDARVIAAPLTGYVSGAGTVAAADTILQAIQKLNGNEAAHEAATAAHGATGAVVGTTNTQTLTNKTLTGAKFNGAATQNQDFDSNWFRWVYYGSGLAFDPTVSIDQSTQGSAATDIIRFTGTSVRDHAFPDASGTVVQDTTAQTLTNKTFVDNVTTFRDETDATKKFIFDASTIATGTTRTYSWPNASGQTLVNGSFQSMDNLFVRGGNGFQWFDRTDPSKRFYFDLALATTNCTTVLRTGQTVDRFINLGDQTGQIVVANDADLSKKIYFQTSSMATGRTVWFTPRTPTTGTGQYVFPAFPGSSSANQVNLLQDYKPLIYDSITMQGIGTVGPYFDMLDGDAWLLDEPGNPIAENLRLHAWQGDLYVSKSDGTKVGLLANKLPSQTGNAGKYLQTNGSATSWQAPSASVAIIEVAVTMDDTYKRVTVTDAAVGTTTKIVGSIRRPDLTADADPGFVYDFNIINQAAGSFDIVIMATDWAGEGLEETPNEALKFLYTTAP
jgi:hypothetical protein